jgi:hypothetical protein
VTRMVLKLAITAGVCGILSSNPITAQTLSPAPNAAHVEIIQGPMLEGAREDLAIIRWISTNPGGSDEHFAVAHYGTDPSDLNQIAKSPNRLNRSHAETIFRVRVDHLKPATTYYYKVTSMGAGGRSDGVESPVNQFTTPPPGEVIANFTQPK